MTDKKLKYKINYYLSTQSTYTIGHFAKRINNYFGVSRDIFNSDRNIPADADDEIPIQRLCMYAAMLDTKVELLKQ